MGSGSKIKWTSFVPLYESVEIQEIYRSIDVKYYYVDGVQAPGAWVGDAFVTKLNAAGSALIYST